MKLKLAKGTRDFSPEEKIARDEILVLLREVCEIYGFSPIETPIFERYETLAAKFTAGEESDAMKETFKLSDQGKRKLALRYDLTVPFSRYVAMNKDIKMPMKKYMEGEVFRDGPIKIGRYRQFTQFDPDVVGCKGMIADAEILALQVATDRQILTNVSISAIDSPYTVPTDISLVYIDTTDGEVELDFGSIEDVSGRKLMLYGRAGGNEVKLPESLILPTGYQTVDMGKTGIFTMDLLYDGDEYWQVTSYIS